MSFIGIGKDKTRELRKRMHQLKIYEKDIKEDFVRSSGPGGQNVNKVSTCVVLKHAPTGIQVKAQQGRTQGINRYKARCRLIEKIQQKQKVKQQRIIQAEQKKRRQNRRRPKALKEKILEGKRQQSEKKQFRRKIRKYDMDD